MENTILVVDDELRMRKLVRDFLVKQNFKAVSYTHLAPDYDDWSLNGDIIVYYDVLDIALELSSMGIRVDETALKQQLEKAGCQDRENLPFQKDILEKKLPYTIGGGIGQSRILSLIHIYSTKNIII